ncbi:MAG: NAD+ synthase [Acidimicrobiia bacterium]|nr:NAD+ synthase [Acidimicrobiia bacterium]
MSFLRIAGAQVNLVVGDVDGNLQVILEAMERAEEAGADVLLLPELAVTGYPPEDLLLRRSFIDENVEGLRHLAQSAENTAVVVGFVDRVDGDRHKDDSVERGLANAAAVLANGAIRGIYHKVLLPNYGVFDEARYFAPGRVPEKLWGIGGIVAGVSVCEDIWAPDGPPALQAAAGAKVLLNINGSPYHVGKGAERASLLAGEAERSGVPVVYLNMVGGQDELVFDGDSMIFDPTGEIIYRAAQFDEEHFVVDVPVSEEWHDGGLVTVSERPSRDAGSLPVPEIKARLDDEAEIYRALVTGLRDYVRKNGFRDVVVGLSGGIDSALTAAIAVDALGPDAVWGITMPTRFSSAGSVNHSLELAANLGCRIDEIPIERVFTEFSAVLEPVFAGTEFGVAEENLQARIRGAILMAVSNKYGGMVVATGNKSELAVGYATLYGDMAGGYAVLKDVFKTVVYRLAEWRNRNGEVIPRAIIDKPPSAELRPDQKDTDSLPEYDVLDQVLRRYIELDQAPDVIVEQGFDRELVAKVAGMVDRNEYKRRQAAPGVRITQKAFGKDRRLPITNRFKD